MGLVMKFLPSFRSPRRLFPIFSVLVLLIFLWAALFRIDTSVVMAGELRPLGQSVRIQNRFEGKVSSELPSVGDYVKKGDSLFSLETDVDQAAIDEVRIQLSSAEARLARLRAQVRLEDKFDLAATDRNGLQQVLDQKAILKASVETLSSQIAMLDAERTSFAAELGSLLEATAGLSEAVDVADKKLALVEQLYKDGYEGELAFLEARQLKIEAVRALNQHSVLIQQLRGKIKTIADRKQTEVSRFKSRAAEELADAVDDYETLLAQQRSMSARFNEYEVTTPVSGTIGRLYVNNLGEVLTPGALVAEIIPEDVPVVFYGRLREIDLPDVSAGQRARVSLSFMDTRTEKPLEASVLSVDPDVTVEEDGSRFYSVVVEIVESRPGFTLYPGSGGSAFLITGDRSVLAYLFDPIYDVFTRALREQ